MEKKVRNHEKIVRTIFVILLMIIAYVLVDTPYLKRAVKIKCREKAREDPNFPIQQCEQITTSDIIFDGWKYKKLYGISDEDYQP
ncbi:MAG: hypothetical protein KBD53_11680 [Candidatus Omnitrophica bacterium]|nr:hypothetical protein [Candidatus Omnitrophota bacterium]